MQSKLNMMGMGSNMMRNIMKKKNIDSLESLIAQAQENGIEFIAPKTTILSNNAVLIAPL